MQSDYQIAASSTTTALDSCTHKVHRNTYMLLGLTMVPTVIGALAGMSLNFAWAAQHPIMFALGSLAAMMGLF